MNISESRVPQDGRILSSTRAQDLRVSSAPTMHGETFVAACSTSRTWSAQAWA
jgi:type II secretory ATPase GspE/PulE/Tfp pilus assembly ATPase PilB-like protein